MDALGFIGLLLGLFALIYLKSVRGMNVLLASMISVVIIILFNRLPVWDTIVESFAGGIGSWTQGFIVVFTLGALLGSSLQSTGCAQAIGESLVQKLGVKYVGIIIHVLSFMIVFAGVDSLVAMLAIAPISIAMVRKANLPRRFAVACFLGGATSYVFALPGSSAVNNLIPVDALGTTITAGWRPGLLGSAVSLVFVLLYQFYLEKKFKTSNRGFDLTSEEVVRDFGCREKSNLPPVWVGFFTLLIVVLCSIFLGGTNLIPSKAAISLGLIVGTAFNLIFGHPYLNKSVKDVLASGANDGIVCSILTGATLGFVNVVQATPVFSAFANWASQLKLPVLLSVVVTMLLMNLVLANSAGTLSVFMSSFAPDVLAAGVQPEILHRVISMSAASFTAQMPHSPGSVVLTSTYKCSYVEIFPDIAVICITGPLVGTLAAIGAIYAGIV